MSTDNKQTVIEYLGCVGRIDTAGMLGHYAEGAKVWLPGQGWMEPTGLTNLLEGARELLVDGIYFTHDTMLADGNHVVLMTACDGALKKGGSYVNQFCFVFTFDDDGKISEMREYTDSGPAIAAFHS